MDKNYGYYNIGIAMPKIKNANIDKNLAIVKEIIDKACKNQISLLIFPEFTISGKGCGSMFQHKYFIVQVEKAIEEIKVYCREKNIAILMTELKNSADKLFVQRQLILDGEVYSLPINHNSRLIEPYCHKLRIFDYESGYYYFEHNNIKLSTSGEAGDISITFTNFDYIPKNADAVFHGTYAKSLLDSNLSISLDYSGLAFAFAKGELLASSELSPDENLMTVTYDFDSGSSIRNKNHKEESDCFDKELSSYMFIERLPEKPVDAYVSVHPMPMVKLLEDHFDQVFETQAQGLAERLEHANSKTMVIGISGGLDSTLALLVCKRASRIIGLESKNIIAITMPGLGTTQRTHANAHKIMEALGVTVKEISIVDSVKQHFSDIDHDPNLHDVTYENSQARERTQILMDIANKTGGLVVGTGDMSEIALGWATFNGDHISMYNPNGNLCKTVIRKITEWIATEYLSEDPSFALDAAKLKEGLISILDTPVSPELLPPTDNGEISQITEDKLGPYELHDFFIYYHVGFGFSPEKIFYLAKKAFRGKYTDDVIVHWLKTFYSRFFSQQFKRRAATDCPRISFVDICSSDFDMDCQCFPDIWLSNL